MPGIQSVRASRSYTARVWADWMNRWLRMLGHRWKASSLQERRDFRPQASSAYVFVTCRRCRTIIGIFGPHYSGDNLRMRTRLLHELAKSNGLESCASIRLHELLDPVLLS